MFTTLRSKLIVITVMQISVYMSNKTNYRQQTLTEQIKLIKR